MTLGLGTVLFVVFVRVGFAVVRRARPASAVASGRACT
jgi:hypothetical protein